MKMIGDQCPGITQRLGLYDNPAQAMQEIITIPISTLSHFRQRERIERGWFAKK
jgi:hypothetical protein